MKKMLMLLLLTAVCSSMFALPEVEEVVLADGAIRLSANDQSATSNFSEGYAIHFDGPFG